MDPLERLGLRWQSIVPRDFGLHRQRREKGEMMFGDVVLPWIEVQDNWDDPIEN